MTRIPDVPDGVVWRMHGIELHGRPADVGLRDGLGNPDFGGN